jgi:uncharacterized protein YpuA (DUF1002 family)
MDMDIEKVITDVLAKLKIDEKLMNAFVADPVKTLEEKLGIDLPDEQINAVVDGIKAKLKLDDVSGDAKGIMNKILSFFKKK